MRALELLAPARDIQIGIAAIDCGADAVYIAGPRFGARQAAGNETEDIRHLCDYAHRYGAKVFVALNTILYDSELEDAYSQALQVQEAGADALIIQDLAVLEMARNGINGRHEAMKIPIHASTQCAIRTPEQAVWLESLGFSRLILERGLSLNEIRAIRDAVSCELECFVHGALCVCYSGQCYLSEMISGRSANRGACIQACRSRYDLVNESGKVLVKDKALLSLKDFNLKNRIKELAECGICSFKIEGRLKNASYVKNVVRDYSMALDEIVSNNEACYERLSFGKTTGGFIPDTAKTFNRGYTEFHLDGKRGKWASMDAAKSMGEEIGTVSSLNRDKTAIEIRPSGKSLSLNNGDGFSFVSRNGNVTGFRGDVCSGNTIRCKSVPDLFVGARIYRNINASFEKELERQTCNREMLVEVCLEFSCTDAWKVSATAVSEDGRKVSGIYDAGDEPAQNQERMASMIESQIGKSVGHYRFRLRSLSSQKGLPFMTSASINAIRRSLADQLDLLPCKSKNILHRTLPEICPKYPMKDATYKNNISNHLSESVYLKAGASSVSEAYELSHPDGVELMRTRYCIRYELGICPVHQGAKNTGTLFLLNNGQRFRLGFDCKSCEMTVLKA